MANKKSGFRWDYDRVSPALKGSKQKAASYLSRVTTYHALRTEGYAKIMAKWKDRSGNARGGLTAKANNHRASQGHHEIVLSHSVDYGIWLEVRWSGKYAIIVPTIRAEAPEYYKTAHMVLDKMFGSGIT